MAVPAVAAVVLAGFGLFPVGQAAVRAQGTRVLVEVSGAAAELVHALQVERAVVAATLSPGARGDAGSVYQAQIVRTRQAEREFVRARAALQDPPAGVVAVLDRVGAALVDLDGQRDRVGSGESVGLSTATFTYRILVADLVGYREAVAQSGVEPGLADQIRAAAALSRAKEHLALEQVAVVQALALGQLTPALNQEFVAARAGIADALAAFGGLAGPQWQSLLARTLTGEDVLAAQRLEGAVSRTRAYAPVAVPGGIAEWNRVMSGQVGLLRSVESAVDADVRVAVLAARNAQLLRGGVQSGLLLAGLLAAMWVTAVVVRSMSSRLALLQQRALAVAYDRLPRVVTELRHSRDERDTSSLAAAAVADAPIVVPGRDEIAELSTAFSEVYAAAVRTAADEAALRGRIAQMFVVIGRRVRQLVELMIADLDRFERDETDPDLLARYFALDQKATRLRRFAGTLLVHAGGGVGVGQRDPVLLHDLVRGALSEVTDGYDRISVERIAEVMVNPWAVGPVVHILAELLDNAVMFSTADSRVTVSAAVVGGPVRIVIDDAGLGIGEQSLDSLNAMLAKPSPDVLITDRMGLPAVARVAEELRIVVRLGPGRRGGTTATVLLPVDLVTEASHEDMFGPADPAAAHPSAAHPPAPVTEEPPAAPPLVTSAATWPATAVTAELARVSPPQWPPVAAAVIDGRDLPIFREVEAVAPISPWLMLPGDAARHGGTGSWRTDADEAWRAARVVATPPGQGDPRTGLPRREPGKHLVTVADAPAPVTSTSGTQRTPDGVRAQIAAAMRGLGTPHRVPQTVESLGEHR